MLAAGSAGSLGVLVAGAGAFASVESGTTRSFAQGLWWAVSLMTTVGFVGAPPTTRVGAVVSVVLMVTGFCLLALVSATLASLFVRDDSASFQRGEQAGDEAILGALRTLQERFDALEERLPPRG